MSETVGSIDVKLTANLAEFKSGLNEGTNEVTRATKQMSREMQAQAHEAKGALVLLGEEIGVHIPRHLQGFITQLPGVGTALSTAFNAIAVLAIIEVLVKVYEKIQKVREEAEKNKEAWEKYDESVRNATDSLKVTNDKLEETLAKLSGSRPNTLKTALDEGIVSADQLATSLEKDIKELEKLIETDNVSFLQKFLGSAGSDDVTEQVKKALEASKTAVEQYNTAVRDAKTPQEQMAIATKAATDADTNYAASKTELNKQLTEANRLQKEFDAQQKQFRYNGPGGYAPSGVDDQKARIKEIKDALFGLGLEYDNLKEHLKNAVLVPEVKTGQGANTAYQDAVKEGTDIINNAKKVAEAQLNLKKEQDADLTALDKGDIDATLKRANDEADLKFRINKKYYEDIIALHTGNSAEDQKAVRDANNELIVIDLNHKAELIKNQKTYDAQEIQLRQDADKAVEAELRKKSDAELQSQIQDLRQQEKSIQDAIKLEERHYRAVEQLIKNKARYGEISHSEEFKQLQAALDQEYAEELKLFNKKVEVAAQELILEAKKNGQILAYDKALKEAQKNLADEKLGIEQKHEDAELKLQHEKSDEIKQMFKQAKDQFSSTLTDQLVDGKAKWSDYFKSLEKMILNFLISAIVQKFLSFLGGVIGNSFGGLGQLGHGDYSGARAAGGPVTGGSSYLVGEHGPELFTPGTSGSITPNGGSSGGASVVYNINASNAQSPAEIDQRIRQIVNQVRPDIVRDAVTASHESSRRR